MSSRPPAGHPAPASSDLATFDRALLDNLYRRASLAIFLVDVDEAAPIARRFTFAEINPVHERLTGLDAEWLRGRTPRELPPLVPEEVALAVEGRYQRCVDAQASITYEEMIPFEGRETWWTTTLMPVRDDAGAVVRLIGTAHEITSRKRVELELEAERQRQAHFAECLRHLHRLSTAHYDSFDALFEDYLRAGTEIFGLPLGIVSRIEGDAYTVRAACSPDGTLARGDAFALDDTLCSFVVRERATVRYHAIGEEAALQSHPVYTTMRLEAYISTPIRVGGRIYGTLNFSGPTPRPQPFTEQEVELIELMADGIGHALELDAAATALENAKDQADRARDAAEAANRAKSTFLSTMSHEIRTPLNGVLGFAELLRMGGALSPEQHRYTEIISQSGQRLMALINDVLDLARVEAGRIALQEEPVDLAALVAEHLEVHAASASAKGIELSYEIEPAVPARLLADGRRLGQVLGNLVSNAVKFTRQGAVHVGVAVASGADGPPAHRPDDASSPVSLRFTVEDTGIGIDAEGRARVFEPFYQVDGSTVRQYQGSGLGLSICRELVEAMGGHIGVTSELGVGTRFVFTVPLRRPQRRRQVIATPAAGDLSGHHALVLVGDATEQQFLAAIFERWAMDATFVSGRAEAQALLDEGERFDVALLDAPQGSAALPLSPSGPPLVLLADDRAAAQAAAPTAAVVAKPVSVAELERTLRRTLAASPSRTAPASTSAVSRYAGLRVIVAEDNPMNRELARGMLHELGVDPAFAENGRLLLDRLETERYDVVLLDVMMPEMDGVEAATRIGERFGEDRPYLVALTARAMREDREAILAAGVDAYVSKPFSSDDLQRALDAAVASRHA